LENLYFIAIVPPEKIQDEITQLKVLVAERFNSKHALKSPPHITLHMPFKWKEKKYDLLIDTMKKINNEVEEFQIELDGFNFYEPRVVYVDVKQNKQLEELQKKVIDLCRKELKINNANYKDRPFVPHITIGFRDLRKPQFYEAKQYFQKREHTAQFKTTGVSLLKYVGGRWVSV